MSSFTVALRCLLSASFLAIALTADGAQINLTIRQVAQTGGTLTYDVNVRPTPLFVAATIIAPDGLIASQHSPIFERGLTYEQLAARFFGEWTIEEVAPSTDVYNFTLADLPQLPVPTMLSPTSGAVLGTTIHAEWAFPGEPLPGPAMSAGSLDQLGFTFDTPINSTERTVFVDLGGLPSSQVFLRGGGGYAINDFVTPPLYHVPGQPHFIVGAYSSLSAPVTVTVVPEPGSIALATFACLSLVASWLGSTERKRRNP